MVKTEKYKDTEKKKPLPNWVKILIIVIVIMIIADVIYILVNNFKKSPKATTLGFISEPIIWRR
jgi:hypothetical protein